MLLLALLASPAAQAQLSGARAIPGDYATVAAAITALNAQGVGAGGVTFNVAAGYTETFASPTAGAITATGTAANPIVFQRSGAGTNPKITAGTGTTTTLDAVISLSGSDYVTFDGIDVAENAANTTTTTQAEFGYALFRATATDGCQFNIIRNGMVTLNKTNAATAATVNITGNSLTNNTVGAAASTTTTFNGVYNAAAAPAVNITGNAVTGNVHYGTTGTTTLVYGAAPTTLAMSTNTVTGNSRATTTAGTMYCLQATGGSITATSNVVNNNTITAAGATSATLWGYYNFSTATAETLTGNTFSNLTIGGSSTATGHTAGGIRSFTATTDLITISQNTVQTIGITAGSGTVYGIYVSSSVPTGNTISRNRVGDLSATGAAGIINGMQISGGGVYTMANNLLGDYRTPDATGLLAINGLQVSGSSGVNAYFNSIYLNATSAGATYGTSGIYLNSNTVPLDARNNIVVNKSAAAGTGGYTVALRRSSGTAGTAPANLASTTINNLYYAGTPSAANLIYVEGSATATNPQQTLTAYKAFVAPRESNSVTEDVPFLSTTGTTATFLHINPAVPTQAESGGTPVAGITTDYDGDARNATTPDIGADEGAFTAQDLSGPSITYTPLSATPSTANRTLTVTITDPSGVAGGANAQRLYYRKGTSGAYVFVNATSVSDSSYTFTLDYTALGGVAAGEVVQYYVAAQDVPGNASTSPLGGAGSNPPGTTAPGTPNQYLIQSALAGTYYMGTSPSPDPTRTYATLTAAIAAYNQNTLGGAVTFVLLDAAYSAATGETFPLTINANADASAINTLTIKPNAGVTPTVSGSVATGAVLKLNGADYVTIDGSNNGATSQNLTIANTAATGAGNAVLWLAAATATDGANFNTVKNTTITGSSATGTPQFTVFLGGVGAGVASPTTSTPAANSNNTLTNNIIIKGYYGLFVFGVSATVLDQNNTITGNQLGQVASGTGFGQEGLRAVYQQGLNVTGNEIQGIANGTTTANLYGIFLADSKSSIISRNSVHGISYSGTSTTKVWAINTSITAFTTAANPSANRFDNNLVYGVSSTAVSGTWNTVGINLGGGYGDQIVYNTVYLSGQLSAAGGTAGSAAFANGNPSVTSVSTNIDVRNNIFSIIGGTGGTATTPLYAHYTQATTYLGSTLNNNDLYVTTGSTGLARIGRINATDAIDLAAWRTATAQEANSVSVDPGFTQTTTVPYNLTPTAAALNSAGGSIVGITSDYLGTTRSMPPDIGAYEFTPPACQAVTGLTFASITSSTASVTFTAPTGGAGANSYTVTYTPAGGTATTVTPNPTGSPVALTGLTANTVYTVMVTTHCTGATSPSATGTFRTGCLAPTYATLPATEGFENTWLSRCDTREVPTANWLNTPLTGNNSWRRDDDGPAANWTSPTSGAFTPAGSQGSTHAARFHSYYASNGTVGTLDYYVDLSAAGTKRLTFDYVNVSTAGSKVDVLLSTDGGATFSTTPLLTVTTSATFSAKTLDLTATSATSIIRFRATSDFGSYDIGVDNVQVRVLPVIDLAATALATPSSTQGCYGSAETVTVTVTNQGTQTLDFAVNPATVTATVTTPGGPQALTGSITTGTLAPGATQNVTLTPTLDMTAAGTYTFAISATVTGDGNTANDALTPAPPRTVAAPVAGTLAPASTSICVSGTASLTLTGAANGTIQYQSSPDNVTFTDVAGATSATYTTPVLTSTTYYRAQVRCGKAVATSNVSTITVNNPVVASTNTPVAICAGSTATLTATAATGTSVRFFDVATGGAALATTTPGSYTTPALTASATYYAEAYTGGAELAGRTAPTVTSGFVSTNYGLVFNTTGAVTLQSAVIYPVGTGTITFALTNAAGTELAATTALSVTGSGATTPVTIPLGLAVPAAGTGYRLVVKAFTGITDLLRENPLPAGSAYPFTSPSGVLSFTNGYLSGTTSTTAYYYFHSTPQNFWPCLPPRWQILFPASERRF